MKFLGMVTLVYPLTLVLPMTIVLPLMAQVTTGGTPVSSLHGVERFDERPPAQSDYLGSPSKSDGRALYRWSLVAITAGNAADTYSSWHKPEGNPLLASSGSDFDGRSLVLKAAFLGASLLAERWALHQNPHLYRTFAWLNFAIAGALGGAVVRNMTQQ